MNPELPSSGPGDNAFANMAMPSFSEHIANQIGLTPDSPPAPTPGLSPTGESTPADNPPIATEVEATEATGITRAPETSGTAGTTETTETTEIPKTATAEATPETTPDFSAEELADVKAYADKLENGAKKDLEMADLLHQFVDSASRQRSVVHQMSTSSVASATTFESAAASKPATTSESAPASTVPNASQNAPEQPETTPKPTIPNAAAAIAEALAETADHPISGQTSIVTPPESTTGEYPLAA